jgi:hypothetical protein
MWLLFDVGLIAARFVAVRKPDEDSGDYQPMSENDMEKELDSIDAGEKGRKT